MENQAQPWLGFASASASAAVTHARISNQTAIWGEALQRAARLDFI